MAKLRVTHGVIDEDVLNSLTDAEKEWLRSWNRGDEIPGDEDVEDDTDEDEEEETGDYSELSNDELKAELERRGLPKSGNKDELIARLEEDDDSDEE
jgi:hypothetical protein